MESQGVLIAECGPGEFLGEAGGWGSSGVMEPIFFGGSKKQQIGMASWREKNENNNAVFGLVSYNDPLFFLGYQSISLRWTDLGNKNYGQNGRQAFFGIHWID